MITVDFEGAETGVAYLGGARARRDKRVGYYRKLARWLVRSHSVRSDPGGFWSSGWHCPPCDPWLALPDLWKMKTRIRAALESAAARSEARHGHL